MLAVAALCAATPASADDDAPFELPPTPEDRPPILAGIVEFHFFGVVSDREICPGDAACIYGRGGGVTGMIERRYPNAMALGLGYDLWFLDGGGVLELPTHQAFRVHTRWEAARHATVHPTLLGAAGVAILGDSFQAETVGWLLHLATGMEIESNESLAFTISLGARLASYSPFTLVADGVERSSSARVNTIITISAGLALQQAP